MRKLFFAAALVSAGILTTAVASPVPQDKKEPAGTTVQAPKAADTVKVDKGKFSIDVSTKVVFEAEDVEEVSIKLEAWTTGMVVQSAVAHGALVKKGDPLVKLDMEKFNKALKDLEIERELSDLAFKQAEVEYNTLQKLLPMDEAAAKLAYENAQEDFKRFMESDLPLQKRNAEHTARSSKNFFEYASEELKQLEKMYKADDIKEETEEIILRRQRDTVENARNMMINNEKRASDTLKYDLPRREQSMKDANERTKINFEKSQVLLPATVRQKQLAFDKTKLDRAKAVERFDNMKADQQKMLNIVAPCDGVVYYGKATKGQWNSSTLESKLAPKGSLPNDEVFMTIIKSNKLAVRGTIEEKDRPLVKVGDQVKVIPTANPDMRISGSVSSIAAAPLGGNYEIRFKLNDVPEGIIAGLTGTVKIKGYARDNVLSVASSAVSYDEDEDNYVAYTPAAAGGKPTKVKVKIGRRSGDKIEILEGLAEGQTVLKEKPSK